MIKIRLLPKIFLPLFRTNYTGRLQVKPPQKSFTLRLTTKLYMGLTNWKHAPDGKILKSDTLVVKNYLNEAHINELNRIVSAYLDLAENRAERGITTNMQKWIQFLNHFLELSQYPILQDKEKISALEAKLKAEQEYEIYRKIQDENYVSDFDIEIKRIQGNKKRMSQKSSRQLKKL
jgi:hypothetical protein